jgi:hypothetical protein
MDCNGIIILQYIMIGISWDMLKDTLYFHWDIYKPLTTPKPDFCRTCSKMEADSAFSW